MPLCWDTIIGPVFEALNPQSIVERGSDRRFNARNLLEFRQRSDVGLYVVEPLAKYDVAAWQEGYGEHATF